MSTLLRVLVAASLAGLPGEALAAYPDTVNSGQTKVIDVHSAPKQVTNNHASGAAMFVPTYSAAEWTSFGSNPPAGVTLVANPSVSLNQPVTGVTSDPDGATYGTWSDMTDGDTQDGMGATSGGDPTATIDLGSSRTIRDILIWQQNDGNFKFNQVQFWISSDNSNFTSIASGTVPINYAANFGKRFSVNTTGRYLKVQTTDRAAYYYSIGEVQVYTAPLTNPPTNFTATPVSGQNSIALAWTNPSGADVVYVVRKAKSTTGAARNYPKHKDDGTVVYSGTGTSHTDTGLTAGTQYYYAAFANDQDAGGISPMDWSAVDTAACNVSNPNLALDKPIIAASIDFDGAYGESHWAVDGTITMNGTTQNARAGNKAEVTIDLKQAMNFSKVVITQPSDTNFRSQNYVVEVSSDNSSYTQVASGSLPDSTSPTNATFSTQNKRYIRVRLTNSFWAYYGIGDIEVYAS